MAFIVCVEVSTVTVMTVGCCNLEFNHLAVTNCKNVVLIVFAKLCQLYEIGGKIPTWYLFM